MERPALGVLAIGWILFGPAPAWENGRPILTQGVASADITYVYDRIGRLIGVVDPAGDTAVYHYDAVGNLTSISRQSSALVSVIDFNPASGPVGTAVTISGTGFSPTASENTVTFNGTAASVSSASPTQLVVTVPTGATTGSIGVTAPAGSASGSSPFTVTATSGAPTITSFTPAIATPGTAVSITGTNFELTPTNNRLRFNIMPAPITTSTATNISVAVPGGATSGRLSLATPGGSTQSTDDFFVPPPPNVAADVIFTGRASIGGATVNAAIPNVGKIGLIVFDGTAGQQVSVGISAGGIVETNTWVFHPNGTQIASVYSDNNGRDIQIESLPVTGTYTIRLAQVGFSTGTKPITLSQDLIVGPIVVSGASVPVNITRPGQRARLTFVGDSRAAAHPRLPRRERLRRDHRHKARRDDLCDVSRQHRPQHRDAVAAHHRDLRDPRRPRYADTRNMTLTLSEEVSGSIVVDGSALPLTLGRVGQVARVTFSATAAQRLNLAVTNANLSTALTILKPDGTTWVTRPPSATALASTPRRCRPLVPTPSSSILAPRHRQPRRSPSPPRSVAASPSAAPRCRSASRGPGRRRDSSSAGRPTQRVSLNITGVTGSTPPTSACSSPTAR